MQPKLIEFRDITKRFGGTIALKGVSLDVGEGEIVALLGENGAGKSTLIKALAGIHNPDSGSILFRGADYRHRPPMPNQPQKVAFIHQDLGLIEWMTVAENVGMAQGFSRRAGLIDWKDTERRTEEALRLVGCHFDALTRVQNLSRTEKSLVAIARALATEADMLVLDEPTASLPADEVERLFEALRPLKAQGVGMIYVSHRLDEVFRIADRVAVMRDGRMIAVKPVVDTTPAELVELIVGRPAEQMFTKAARRDGPVRLAVKGLNCQGAADVNFEARAGELLGLIGLRGAGQEAVGRALFGAEPHTGEVLHDGQSLDLSSIDAAMAAGVGLIARDRTEESAALSLSVRENMYLNPGAGGRGLFSFLTPSSESGRTFALGQKLGLRPNDPNIAIEALSGGNQQKVVVGRWLSTGRKLLIMEDPTAGVDVGAKADIYRLIAQAMDDGLTVIVVSTDFEEVAHICHRALVFSQGRIVGELEGKALTTTALIHAASVSQAA